MDELLAKVDYVPGLAVRYCCSDGKTITLGKILETFPNVAIDGKATRQLQPSSEPSLSEEEKETEIYTNIFT